MDVTPHSTTNLDIQDLPFFFKDGWNRLHTKPNEWWGANIFLKNSISKLLEGQSLNSTTVVHSSFFLKKKNKYIGIRVV